MIHLAKGVYISHQMTRMHLGFELKANTILWLKNLPKVKRVLQKRDGPTRQRPFHSSSVSKRWHRVTLAFSTTATSTGSFSVHFSYSCCTCEWFEPEAVSIGVPTGKNFSSEWAGWSILFQTIFSNDFKNVKNFNFAKIGLCLLRASSAWLPALFCWAG